MENVLKNIVCEMVDMPETIVVENTIDERGVLLTIHAHKDDMGRIVGRGGQTALALRTIMRTIGKKNGQNVSVLIAEPEE